MKNMLKFLGIVALVAVIGFSFVSCSSGGGGGGPVPTSATYTDSDGEYSLVVTKGRAAYNPQSGDSYVLTILGVGTSSGMVSSVSDGAFVLSPSFYGSDDFIVVFNGTTITSFFGGITFDDGKTFESKLVPEPFTGNISGTYTNTDEWGITGTITFNANGTASWSFSGSVFGMSINVRINGNYTVEGNKITFTVTSVTGTSDFLSIKPGDSQTLTIISANLLLDDHEDVIYKKK